MCAVLLCIHACDMVLYNTQPTSCKSVFTHCADSRTENLVKKKCIYAYVGDMSYIMYKYLYFKAFGYATQKNRVLWHSHKCPVQQGYSNASIWGCQISRLHNYFNHGISWFLQSVRGTNAWQFCVIWRKGERWERYWETKFYQYVDKFRKVNMKNPESHCRSDWE